MRKIEDILTGILLIGSTVIAIGIIVVGIVLIVNRSNFMPLTLLVGSVFLIWYTLRNIYIGLNLIVHGRYEDEMTVRESRKQ